MKAASSSESYLLSSDIFMEMYSQKYHFTGALGYVYYSHFSVILLTSYLIEDAQYLYNTKCNKSYHLEMKSFIILGSQTFSLFSPYIPCLFQLKQIPFLCWSWFKNKTSCNLSLLRISCILIWDSLLYLWGQLAAIIEQAYHRHRSSCHPLFVLLEHIRE